MTAYDEFLQASPYLDALRNEYDRIFMTSLKNILAEYRAVKIYGQYRGVSPPYLKHLQPSGAFYLTCFYVECSGTCFAS